MTSIHFCTAELTHKIVLTADTEWSIDKNPQAMFIIRSEQPIEDGKLLIEVNNEVLWASSIRPIVEWAIEHTFHHQEDASILYITEKLLTADDLVKDAPYYEVTLKVEDLSELSIPLILKR